MSELPLPDPDQERDRHGFRGTPPPAKFSLAELPDDALLTEQETAAVGRWSTNTLSGVAASAGSPAQVGVRRRQIRPLSGRQRQTLPRHAAQEATCRSADRPHLHHNGREMRT